MRNAQSPKPAVSQPQSRQLAFGSLVQIPDGQARYELYRARQKSQQLLNGRWTLCKKQSNSGRCARFRSVQPHGRSTATSSRRSLLLTRRRKGARSLQREIRCRDRPVRPHASRRLCRRPVVPALDCSSLADLAIDSASRWVGGLFVGMEPPNAGTVALLLSRLALPKAPWLEALGNADPMRTQTACCVSASQKVRI